MLFVQGGGREEKYNVICARWREGRKRACYLCKVEGGKEKFVQGGGREGKDHVICARWREGRKNLCKVAGGKEKIMLFVQGGGREGKEHVICARWREGRKRACYLCCHDPLSLIYATTPCHSCNDTAGHSCNDTAAMTPLPPITAAMTPFLSYIPPPALTTAMTPPASYNSCCDLPSHSCYHTIQAPAMPALALSPVNISKIPSRTSTGCWHISWYPFLWKDPPNQMWASSHGMPKC